MKEVRVTCDYCRAEISGCYIEVDAAGSSPLFISRNVNGEPMSKIVFANQTHYCDTDCFSYEVRKRFYKSVEVPTTPEDQAVPDPETDPHPEALPAEVPAVPEIIPVAPAPKEKPKAPRTMMVQAKRKPGRQKMGVQDTYYHKNKFAAKLGYGGVADAFKHMEKKEFEKQFEAYRKEINDN